MDSHIKTLLKYFCIISLLLVYSCTFDDVHFYEIKINNWASVSYTLYNNKDTTTLSYFEVYSFPEKRMEKGKKIEINSESSLEGRERIMQNCIKMIYNDNFILALDGRSEDTTSTYYEYNQYYKITPIWTEGKREPMKYKDFYISDYSPKTYKIIELSANEFDSIARDCKNCDYIDISKIRKCK